MKILFLTERFPPQRGGVAVAALRHARGLSAHLDRLDVVHLTADLPAGMCTAAPLDAVRPERGEVRAVGRTPREDESLQILEQVARSARRVGQHDLVHGFFAAPAGTVATLVARLEGVPSVVSLRGNDVDRGIYQAGRQVLWTLRHADRVLCVSRELGHKTRALVGREDWIFTPNAVEGSIFRPGPPESGLRERLRLGDGPVLAFSGELRFKKGMPMLLDLVEQLVADGLAGLRLLLVGGVRRDEREAFERWRRSAPGAAACVVEVGYERDEARLRDLYNLCDLLVFPSLWEGMPNAVLEAMACARPVLAVAAGGVRDLVRDGDTGWLVDSHALDRLVPRAREILALPADARLVVGARAREHVLRHHRPELEIERVLAVYRDLLGSSSA